MAPSTDNLAGLWEAAVRRDPRALAVVDGADARAWSRSELAEAARAWRGRNAEGLDLGGRCVVLAQGNGSGWLSAFLGLLASGAVPALVDPDEPAAVREAVARAIGAEWIWTGGGSLESVRSTDCVDAARAGRPGGRPEGIARPRPRVRARRPDLCLAKITSGTTGLPKALFFTHAQMAADGRQICATMGIGPGDVNLAVVPFGHSYGLGNLVLPLLLQGTALACSAGPFPQAIAETGRARRPTVLPAVPVIFRALVRADLSAEDLPGLRLAISAGSPLCPGDAAAFQARFGCRVHGFYGTSETGGICFDRTGEATLAGRSVGQPLVGVRLSAGRGRRILVTSPAVMGSGRHSPRDFGALSEDGELTLLGRAGRGLKIGGRRLDPGEIEAALLALPGIEGAVVLPHPSRPDRLAAAVVSGQSAAAIRQALAGKLAPWKIPDRILALAELPVTARGKTDRKRIEAMLSTAPR